MEYRRQGSVGRVGPALRRQRRDSLAGLLGLLIVHSNEAGQQSPAEARGRGHRTEWVWQLGGLWGAQQCGSKLVAVRGW